MELVNFLSQVDKTSINLEQAKHQLEQAKLRFEQAKLEFDETVSLADKFNLSRAKLKKLTDDRIQSLRENVGALIGGEAVLEIKPSQPKKKGNQAKKARGAKGSLSSKEKAEGLEELGADGSVEEVESLDALDAEKENSSDKLTKSFANLSGNEVGESLAEAEAP